MNGTQEGYFTEEQCDRMNLKTMANPLPVPWNGHHLLALLVHSSDLGVQLSGMSPEDSKQTVVDWYCKTPADDVVDVLETMSREPEFQALLQFQEMVHRDPEGVAKAIEAIENGWMPGDPV